MRLFFALLTILFLILMTPLVVLAVVLIFQAEMSHSRYFAFGFLALFATVILLFQVQTAEVGRPGRWAFLMAIITAGLLGYAYQESPTGATTQKGARFESHYPAGAHYPRWHPSNLVAEIDQLKVAATISPLAGKGIKGARTRGMMAGVYQKMRQETPEMVGFGSQTYQAYQDWMWIPMRGEHTYVYRPKSSKGRTRGMPVLLVVHANFGNLKGPLWCLKPLADRFGMAIVAPSFGTGRWDDVSHRDGVDAVMGALSFCEADPGLDAQNVILVGYGVGGKGVARVAHGLPNGFRALMFIGSPLTSDYLTGAEFRVNWKKKPIFVAHGTDDARFPIKYVEETVSDMKSFELSVTYQRYKDQDGYLLFDRADEVCAGAGSWISRW